ncbi:unannotated protein [freshwater metagenome]|uniref:Unannotated protein n=1 Tax=freshwater metagenome TaxID=449393 RepID=A0A6J6I5D1_9ZZZZ
MSDQSKREPYFVLGLLALSGALILILSSPQWASASVLDAALPRVNSGFSSRAIVPIAPATGLLALASAVACLLAGRWWRTAIGLVLVGFALSATLSIANFLSAPGAALSGPLSDLVGLTQIEVAEVTVSIWPRLVLVLCAVVALCGLWIVVRARTWQRGGRRYERSDESTPANKKLDAAGLWDAIDRGTDPTFPGF